MDHQVLNEFQLKLLTYTSRYFYKSSLMNFINYFSPSHKSWIDVFETDKKQEVEHKCRDNEFNWRWLEKNWLEIKQTRPATLINPLTQEKVWFNQAHLYDFNPKLLGLTKYLGAKLFYYQKSRRLHEVSFADGTKIPRQYFYYLLDFYKEKTVAFPWQQHDMLILDNILAMHGRAPFSGKRRILTAMTS